MKINYNFLKIILVLSCNNLQAIGQGSYIYGVHMKPGAITNDFARYDTTTGTLTDLQTIPGLTGFGTIYTSCTDPVSNRYYFCSGKRIIGFDMSTGNIVLDHTLPLAANANYYSIQFNQCNGLFYGLISNFSNLSLATYDTTTGILSTVSPNLGTGIIFGSMSFIDYSNSRYVWEYLNTVAALDLSTGQFEFNTTILNLPNELFFHIVYKCSNQTIYGTSANPAITKKYLAVFDTSSGNVTHVSNTGWSLGIYKPVSGGFTIDQTGGIYYYIGTPGFIMLGVSTATGTLVHSKNLNLPTGEGFFLIQKPGCICNTTGFNETTINSGEINIFPIPFSDRINIISNNKELSEIILYDITARKLCQQKFINTVSLNTEQLVKGIYLYEVKNKNGVIRKGKVVKD